MTTLSRRTSHRFIALAGLLATGAILTVAPVARGADLPGYYSPADFGAVFDGKTNGAAAMQKAIDAATAAGGGTVVMPAGRTLLTGSFELKSHVTLRLDPGSRLVASTEQADYSEEALVRARHAEDVAIVGTGTIDGQGDSYMISKGPYIYHAKAFRPKLVMFEDVHRAHLTDFTLSNAPRFTVQFRGCEDVTVQGISIYNNPEIPNNDGIDPVCSRNVRIIGCTIVTGDDCIAISNTETVPRYGACENILVSNCVLSCQDSALKIGSGTFGDVRNIMFTDCVVKLALRGVDIMARDAGNVENVVARNILIQTHLFAPPWWGASEAVYITAVPRTPETKLGHVRGVHISGITAHGEAGVFIRGTPDSPIEDVHLEDVTLDIAKTTTWPSRIDLRPSQGQRLPQDKDIIVAGFDLQDAKGVTLRNCAVRWGPNPPANFGPVVQTVRVTGLDVDNLRGVDAHPPSSPPNSAKTKTHPSTVIYNGNPMNVGVTSLDAKWSNYGKYLQQMITTVQEEWDTILGNHVWPMSGTTVTVKFRMAADGTIASVLDVSGTATEPGKQYCISAICNPAPYGRWTNEMMAQLGTHQDMTFVFYYQ